jgi:hypothetical protein
MLATGYIPSIRGSPYPADPSTCQNSNLVILNSQF